MLMEKYSKTTTLKTARKGQWKFLEYDIFGVVDKTIADQRESRGEWVNLSGLFTFYENMIYKCCLLPFIIAPFKICEL